MNSTARDTVRAATSELDRAQALLSEALDAIWSARSVLAHPSSGFPVPVSEDGSSLHERRLRGGRGQPFKIDTDPELKAFVMARIFERTYQQIAQDIASEFPPDRHVSRSSIARWWAKTRPAEGSTS